MDLKTLATFATPIEAEMLRGCLGAAGIEAFLADDQTVGWLWHLGGAMKGVKVRVAELDLPRARELLDEMQQSRLEPAVSWTCPGCQAVVGGDMDVCWACGMSADGVEDPGFSRAEDVSVTTTEESPSTDSRPGPVLALMIAIGLPLIIAVFVAGVDLFSGFAPTVQTMGILAAVISLNVVFGVTYFQRLYYLPPSHREASHADEPARTGEADTDEDDAHVASLAPDHAIARRAVLAAVFGLMACPPLLHIYSAWLILAHRLWRQPAAGVSRGYIYAAIVIDAAVALLFLFVFWRIGTDLYYLVSFSEKTDFQ